MNAVGFAEFVERNDMLVPELGGVLGLLVKARQHLLLISQIAG